MPFKVVQTIERGKICISAVPNGWERDGILWWPPNSQMGFVTDENSVPKDKWKTFSCIVKRQYRTYKEASEEAEKMEAETDTEQEEHETGIQGNTISVFGDFNSMINIQNDGPLQSPATPALLLPQVGEHIEINDCNLESSFIMRNNDVYSDLIQNQKKIIALLEKQAEDTKRIFAQLAKHEACLGEIYNKIGSSSNMDTSNLNNNIMIEQFPPVKTLKELKDLEENLKDANFKSKYIRSMSTLCSRGSNMKGLSLCYRLIDFFVTRDLLLECSWTGNARNDGTEKTAFKFFERIRSTFFSIVRNADPSFCQIECDQFFKRILKNSKQRSSVKPQKNLIRKTSNPSLVNTELHQNDIAPPLNEISTNLVPEDETELPVNSSPQDRME